jgi:predicted nuclease of predicted toxin-antitoxin system
VKFLIDECLSASLVQLANTAGYEAYHVNYLGKQGSKDYELLKLIFKEEFTFVTNDARDFKKLVAATELHPGLVLIVPCATSAVQKALFQLFLEKLGPTSSLINSVVEVDLDAVRIYQLPTLV